MLLEETIDSIALFRKTIGELYHNSKQTENNQETYGCTYRKLRKNPNEEYSYLLEQYLIE